MGLHKGENSTLSRMEEVTVNDGEWHHLQLDISSLGGALSNHKAVLSLDQGLYLVSVRSSLLKVVMNLTLLFLHPLSLCHTPLIGKYGGGREAARLQAEDCERWWSCKA